KNQNTCSDTCRKQHLKNRELLTYSPREFNCKECGTSVTTTYGDKSKRYCSEKCSLRHGKRITKATRRARKKEVAYETIDPFKVFNRDKWTCKLCGIKTPRKLRGLMVDNAPELDHII